MNIFSGNRDSILKKISIESFFLHLYECGEVRLLGCLVQYVLLAI